MPAKKLSTHLLSFLTALFLCTTLLLIFYSNRPEKKQPETIISGKQEVHRGVYDNLSRHENSEVEFMASLKNPDQLTIFGSSEFTSSNFCPYYFLPDSMGIPALGLGHAHHQSFSILCELLAAYDFIENSKICIIISPSWFSTPGTNSEAFTEFVRPNLLKTIAANDQIEVKYKSAIGKFIYEHQEEFTSLTNTMEYFVDTYLLHSSRGINFMHAKLRNYLKEIHPGTFQTEKVRYEPETSKHTLTRSISANKSDFLINLQKDFLSKITNNDLFVNDEYFTKHVLTESGQIRIDSISEVDLIDNQELEDFRLVVELLASKNANCTFVIQPLNPFYYQHTDRNLPLIDTLTNLLDSKKFPYLNLYAANKETYEPGVLRDVMHLSDYGWMKINFFLDSIYYEN